MCSATPGKTCENCPADVTGTDCQGVPLASQVSPGATITANPSPTPTPTSKPSPGAGVYYDPLLDLGDEGDAEVNPNP